jgi:hypothetical protein
VLPHGSERMGAIRGCEIEPRCTWDTVKRLSSRFGNELRRACEFAGTPKIQWSGRALC